MCVERGEEMSDYILREKLLASAKEAIALRGKLDELSHSLAYHARTADELVNRLGAMYEYVDGLILRQERKASDGSSN